MKIAVVSDTHNQTALFSQLISEVKRRDIRILIHCGDLTDPSLLQACKDLKVFYAFGNGDHEFETIRERLTALNPESKAADLLDFEVDGERFFAAHGDQPRLIQAAIESGQYDWVLQGHTHRYKAEEHGKTLWLNPSAIGGNKFERRGFLIIETGSERIERLFLDELL